MLFSPRTLMIFHVSQKIDSRRKLKSDRLELPTGLVS